MTIKVNFLHEYIEHWAQTRPQAIALEREDKSISYEELNKLANSLSRTIQDRYEISTGEMIAFRMTDSLNAVITLLAIVKLGCTYIPIDDKSPTARVDFILKDANPSLFVVDDETILFDFPDVKRVSYDALINQVVSELENNISLNLSPNTLAYVIYTSGTTGVPKGVLIEHSNVISLLNATKSIYPFSSKDNHVLYHSLAFDVSVWELFLCFSHGAKIYIPSETQKRSPKAFIDVLLKQNTTILNQTPSAFGQLLEMDGFDDFIQSASLELIVLAGEKLNFRMLEKILVKDKSINIINMYGITEVTIHATYYNIDKQDYNHYKSLIGQPLPGNHFLVLDNELKEVEDNHVGELYIAGPRLAQGYLNLESLVQERFINIKGQRYYKTGDLVRGLGNNNHEYIGRNDDQIKLNGYRIELAEVEVTLAKYNNIQEVKVLKCDIELGSFLVAFMKTKDSSHPPTNAQLSQHLLEKLPNYMVPMYYIMLEKFPITINGKIDTLALKNRFISDLNLF